eukprot:scaffold5338_cov112-Cylindrotheca_fusiformis.AAC.3
MDYNVTAPPTGESVLKPLLRYDHLRLNATGNITRKEGSNVDVFQDTDTEEDVVLFNLIGLLSFTRNGGSPFLGIHIDATAIALAAHHLNVGDGTIVPEVEGLNERCNIRFTVEFADTQFDAGTALDQVVHLISRDARAAERLPSAFVGTGFSETSVPTSIVTGLFGYPQVSGSAGSTDLDDRSLHQLFGRTMPSEADSVVPIVIYLRDVLHVMKLVVVHTTDPYGNANALGVLDAARKYAPDMDIISIPMTEGEDAEKATIEAVKETGYRYVLCTVIGTEKLMTEAYNMGVAGKDKHNWFFSRASGGPDDRYFEKGSPLSLAYRGGGKLEMIGGLEGMTAFDSFTEGMGKLRNLEDLEYLASLFPESPGVGGNPPFVGDGSYLSAPLASSYAARTFDATIALGLSACSGVSSDGFLDGETHFKHFTETSFAGASGRVSFDNVTGTRDVTGAIFRLTNFVPTEVVDDETGETVVSFTPYVTDVFQDGKWEEVREFIFNDGTPNIPPDSPPIPVEEGPQWAHTILAPIVVALAAVIGIFLIFERKRRQSDSLWYIKKEELKFANPPEVIGRGGFGLILRAEYRGTDVAVKRVLPPSRQAEGMWKRNGNAGTGSANSAEKGRWKRKASADTGSLNSSGGPQSKAQNTGKQHNGLKSVADNGSIGQSVSSSSVLGCTSDRKKSTIAIASLETSRSKLRKNFIMEMRVLSKLRHSCIATIMGAVLERGSEPMLIMEYMDHGSLCDVLHNETMHIESNLLLHILQDVSQGMRFLHSSIPQVIHCDIKSVRMEDCNEISSGTA